MALFGGEMRFTFNGTPLVMRGAIKTMPSRYNAEKVVNQDGSISASMQPQGYDGEVTFEDAAGVNWDTILLGGPYNVTVVEDVTGVIHQFTGARFFGRPSVDRATGEVSGITSSSPSDRMA